MLGIPCGDWHRMRRVRLLQDMQYVRADVIADLVERIRREHESARRTFLQLDVRSSRLPSADLLLCRDLLVHFSFDEIQRSLRNVTTTPFRFLLTTTYTQPCLCREIRTGEWRPVNFELPPFELPPPLEYLDERCTERDGRYRDKTLALWRVADVAAALGRTSTR